MTHATAPRSTSAAIRSVAPTFLVSDIAATVDWYVANLGFELAGTHPAQPPYVFASMMRGPAEIMLLDLAGYGKPDLRSQRPVGLWDAYIRVDGVTALYETLDGKPFVQMPLTHQPYHDWEFEVRDPNGYVLVFGGSP
ncbi:MAG TPA: VOC family protein [Gemmatimonadaceae bacterium]|nr:VOC family protein [Gemmatimonadaceae bacterium]